MSWDEVKKALNSTVGTSEAKSLDEIIEDKINVAVTTFKPKVSETGTKKVVYSGNFKAPTEQQYTSNCTVLAKFIAPVTGIYKVQLTQSSTGYIYGIYKTMPNAQPLMVYQGSDSDIAVSNSVYGNINVAELYDKVSIGSQYRINLVQYQRASDKNSNLLSIWYENYEGDSRYYTQFGGGLIPVHRYQEASTRVQTNKFLCQQGEPVILIQWNGQRDVYLKNLSIEVSYMEE